MQRLDSSTAQVNLRQLIHILFRFELCAEGNMNVDGQNSKIKHEYHFSCDCEWGLK